MAGMALGDFVDFRRATVSQTVHVDVAPLRPFASFILGSFWDHFGIILGSLWGHVGITLGSLWDYFGIALESFWDHFGMIFEHFYQNKKVSKIDSPALSDVKLTLLTPSRAKIGQKSNNCFFVYFPILPIDRLRRPVC